MVSVALMLLPRVFSKSTSAPPTAPKSYVRPVNAGTSVAPNFNIHKGGMCHGYLHGLCVVPDPLHDNKAKRVCERSCTLGGKQKTLKTPRPAPAGKRSKSGGGGSSNRLSSSFNLSTSGSKTPKKKVGGASTRVLVSMPWRESVVVDEVLATVREKTDDAASDPNSDGSEDDDGNPGGVGSERDAGSPVTVTV